MKNALLKRGLEITGFAVLSFGSIGFGLTEVQMTTEHQFAPKIITIAAGETVRFVNPTNRTHTVTADPAMEKKKGDVILPTGASPFHSGAIEPGQSFEHAFTVPGTYQYVCLPHELHGMIGQIVVKPAVSDDIKDLKVDCELDYTTAAGLKNTLKAASKTDGTGKYVVVKEEVPLDGDRKAELYVYYDGKYSAINFYNLKNTDFVLNADAEVEIGKLFTLSFSNKEGTPLKEVYVTCSSK